MFVQAYQNTRCHIPEYRNFKTAARCQIRHLQFSKKETPQSTRKSVSDKIQIIYSRLLFYAHIDMVNVQPKYN
jgi:hypothetical protein